jgi:two-component system NarL family sensor kinase
MESGQKRQAASGDRRTRELSVLNAVAEALNSAPDVRQALQLTLSLMADLLGLHTGWVWLVDPDSGRFYSAAAQNLPPYLQQPVRMTGKPCWCIQSFQAGRLTPKNIDMLECSRLRSAIGTGEVEATEGLRYHASIPVFFREQPLGIMNLTGPDYRGLSRDELRLLSTVASQVGVAIERARLAEASAQLARAEERTRIAREIHDTLAQGLTGITLNLEGALNLLERDPERARQRLQSALDAARESLEEARRSVLDLRSDALPKPLPESLGSLARAFTAETGVRARVRLEGTVDLPQRVELELYRIVQEALANVRRHARATEVEIVLRGGPRTVRLAIRDNGSGFDTAAIPAGHHGIVGMKERARLVGSRLRVASRPGSGTAVTVTVPRGEDAA